jgi:hypothetical protein
MQSHDRASQKGAGFAVCIRNGGYSVSLELHRVYRLLADPEAESYGLVRIVDESGEGYLLYPAEFFHRVAPMPGQRLPDGTEPGFALCIRNGAETADRPYQRIHLTLPDASAERRGYVRVMGPSGDGDLHPASAFLPIDVPEALRDDLLRAS